MKTSSADVTVVLVGGGSIIIPEELTGVKALIRNENGAVANAIGASIAQISGQYEQIYVYSKIQRDAALADAQEKAVNKPNLRVQSWHNRVSRGGRNTTRLSSRKCNPLTSKSGWEHVLRTSAKQKL